MFEDFSYSLERSILRSSTQAKRLDTLSTVATLCTWEKNNPKCRGFEARPNNYGRLRDGQSQ